MEVRSLPPKSIINNTCVVSPQSLFRKIKDHHPSDILLIDTRSEAEFKQCSILGAINIDITVNNPLDQLHLKPLLKYCHHYHIILFDQSTKYKDPVETQFTAFFNQVQQLYEQELKNGSATAPSLEVNNDENKFFKARSIRMLNGGLTTFKGLYYSLCTNSDVFDVSRFFNVENNSLLQILEFLHNRENNSGLITNFSQTLKRLTTSIFKYIKIKNHVFTEGSNKFALKTYDMIELHQMGIYATDVGVLNDSEIIIRDSRVEFKTIIDLTTRGFSHELLPEFIEYLFLTKKICRFNSGRGPALSTKPGDLASEAEHCSKSLETILDVIEQAEKPLLIVQDLQVKDLTVNRSLCLFVLFGCLIRLKSYNVVTVQVLWFYFVYLLEQPELLSLDFQPVMWEALARQECTLRSKEVFSHHFLTLDEFLSLQGTQMSIAHSSFPPFLWYLSQQYDIKRFIHFLTRIYASTTQNYYNAAHNELSKYDLKMQLGSSSSVSTEPLKIAKQTQCTIS